MEVVVLTDGVAFVKNVRGEFFNAEVFIFMEFRVFVSLVSLLNSNDIGSSFHHQIEKLLNSR